MKTRYEIVSQHGTTRSRHHTLEAAQRQMDRNLAWRCGICGSSKAGWGRCSHGSHNRCSAEHYNDRIVDLACERCGQVGDLKGLGLCASCFEYMHEHCCGLCHAVNEETTGGMCARCAAAIAKEREEDMAAFAAAHP